MSGPLMNWARSLLVSLGLPRDTWHVCEVHSTSGIPVGGRLRDRQLL